MIVIELEIPHPYLSPNYTPVSRAGHMAKARARKAQREAARKLAMEQKPVVPFKKAMVHLAYYDSQQRGKGRDYDNATGCCKGALDGIADAGIVENDNAFVAGQLILDFDKDDPRLLIGIEEIAQ